MIPRGYVANHKISNSFDDTDRQLSTIFTVECPSCKHQMELPGDYSEQLDNDMVCSNCKIVLPGYNFTFLKSTIR
jgi:hypothetical protein